MQTSSELKKLHMVLSDIFSNFKTFWFRKHAHMPQFWIFFGDFDLLIPEFYVSKQNVSWNLMLRLKYM